MDDLQRDTAWERLISVVRRTLGQPPGTVLTRETRIVEDLGADSLDAADLIIEMEWDFKVVVSDEVAAKWSTLGDVAKWIEENADLASVLATKEVL